MTFTRLQHTHHLRIGLYFQVPNLVNTFQSYIDRSNWIFHRRHTTGPQPYLLHRPRLTLVQPTLMRPVCNGSADSLLGAVGTSAEAEASDGRTVQGQERANEGDTGDDAKETVITLGRGESRRLTSKVDVQHCRVPLLQLLPPRAEMGSGAAATTEERATTGKRRADARMNIFTDAKRWEY